MQILCNSLEMLGNLTLIIMSVTHDCAHTLIIHHPLGWMSVSAMSLLLNKRERQQASCNSPRELTGLSQEHQFRSIPSVRA